MKTKTNTILVLSLSLALWTANTPVAYAIPPPDFLFQAGSQVVQAFSVLVLVVGMVIGFLRYYLQQMWASKKARGVMAVLMAVVVMWGIVLSFQSSSEELMASLGPSFSTEETLLLDVREDEERAVGHLPGSVHIRRADVLAGEWRNLPQDRPIIVLCYSGARAQEVSDFLKKQGFQSQFFEGGLNAWKARGGDWKGELKFSHDDRLFSLNEELAFAEVQQHLSDGAILVDGREQRHFEWWHVPGSLSVPSYFTPSDEMERLLDTVPTERDVILLCDGIARGCFSSTISGLKLMERGHRVLGRTSDMHAYKAL